MSDRSKVTVVLTEADARWLLDCVFADLGTEKPQPRRQRIKDELRHALAECDCAGEVGR